MDRHRINHNSSDIASHPRVVSPRRSPEVVMSINSRDRHARPSNKPAALSSSQSDSGISWFSQAVICSTSEGREAPDNTEAERQ